MWEEQLFDPLIHFVMAIALSRMLFWAFPSHNIRGKLIKLLYTIVNPLFQKIIFYQMLLAFIVIIIVSKRGI